MSHFYPFSETTYQKSFIYNGHLIEKKNNATNHWLALGGPQHHFSFILLACYFTSNFTIQSISTGINDYEYDPTLNCKNILINLVFAFTCTSFI